MRHACCVPYKPVSLTISEPEPLSSGTPVTVDTPVLRYFKFDAKAGVDLNITLTAENSDGEFFGDTESV